MATRTSTQSGAWSATATWADATVPLDDDDVIITAGHAVEFDVDQSGFANGIAGLVIRQSSKLYFKHSAAGAYHLKIKTGTHITGTISGSTRGELVASHDGSVGSTTAIPYDRKCIIDLQGTAQLQATKLQCNLRPTEPSNTFVQVYGVAVATVAQATKINTTTGVVDWGTAPPAAGTAVRIQSSGTMPTGWFSEEIYYIRSISGNTSKLAGQNLDTTVVIPSAVGSGNLTLYTGWVTTDAVTWGVGKDTPLVIENVTADNWTVGDAVTLCNENGTTYDQQRLTILAINAGSIQLSEAANSNQFALSKIVLVSRNVEIRSSGTTNAQAIVLFDPNDTHGGRFGAIRKIDSTGTTFTGYGLSLGANATVSSIGWCNIGLSSGSSHSVIGTISGCGTGLSSGTSHSVIGTISGCNNGLSSGTSHTITGTISGCSTGISTGTAHSVIGTISSCSTGISTGTAHSVIGTISSCSNTGINSGTAHSVTGTISGCGIGIYYGTAHSVIGTISGCNHGINSGTAHSVIGTISGCSTGIYYGTGCIVTGTISGCSTGINDGIGHSVIGAISGCSTGIYDGSYNLNGTVFSTNTYDLRLVGPLIGYGCSLRSTTQNFEYKNNLSAPIQQVIYDPVNSSDVLQKGRILAWCSGGTCTSDEATVPASPPIVLSWSHLFTFEAPFVTGFVMPVWVDIPIRLKSGQKITIPVYLKLSATGFTEPGKVQIIDPNKGWDTAASKLFDQSLTDTASWQTINAHYTADYDKIVHLRVRAVNTAGTGTLHWWADPNVHPTLPAEKDMKINVEYGYAGNLLTGELTNVLTVGGNQMRRI